MKITPRRAGFTLVELMIVFAIIAVIAAIAIPSMLAVQRAANERNASASLKSFLTAETDFRSNDRDGNLIQDFWVRDVSGLYGMVGLGMTNPVKLIDISLSAADTNPQGTAAAPTEGDQTDSLYFSIRSAKSQYWFAALEADQHGAPFATLTQGSGSLADKPWFNRTKFGFMAYPDAFNSGRNMFIINESYGLFRRALVGEVRPLGGTVPPGIALRAAGASGSSPLLTWPTDDQHKTDYVKTD